MPNIEQSERVQALENDVIRYAKYRRHEFCMPEHLLYVLLLDPLFLGTLAYYCDVESVKDKLMIQLDETETVPSEVDDYSPEPSELMIGLYHIACAHVIHSAADALDVPHLVVALLSLKDSWAAYLLNDALGDKTAEFISQIVSIYECDHFEGQIEDEMEVDDNEYSSSTDQWRKYVTCLNDISSTFKPLIGREKELERTIQILCRKDKNNPLHVGEPGVGKTALVHGLVSRIVSGAVPENLKPCKVYLFDIGTILAGTQFRGDFERRIKMVMDGIEEEGNGIVYIDEIHNLVGAGQTGEGAMDASNMLKPYLEQGGIRFIGSTTYDEYNRHFSKHKGVVRRFLQMDIAEPSVDETISILHGLKESYENFHGVEYTDEAIAYAVRQSAKYINDRYLPDKAIDLIDEAGAAARLSDSAEKVVQITQTQIDTVLQKICKIDAVALKEDNNDSLENLRERIQSKIYGQNEAVSQVVEAIQMSKAGLLDDGKPLASLLFVGPTGVGKTEVARVLSQELGIQLVRFDMSEYTEKHTVAKLIGSPAGYVGYEDGGLLTDAIRKTPNCVLLLDEIEKAHQDIYNILLQVMDYASLTDNRGRKADFRNVVLLMTSNAGAQYAGQRIGFEPAGSRGEAMMKQVKRVFKPEFLNRLSGTVIFHDMDMHMAGLILDKKLRELQTKLAARNVTMSLADDAREYLLQKGFTQEYGAREIDRVLSRSLKPMLMHEILFGRLKSGGEITITLADIKERSSV